MANWKRPDMGASIQRGGEVGETVPLFKPQSGKGGRFADTWIRILPIRDDSPYEEFYYWAAVHFPPGQGGLPFLCGRKMFDTYPEGGYNAACPACDAATFGPDGSEGTSKWYGVMNVVVLNDDGEPEDGKVLIWACPRTVLNDLLGEIEELPKEQQDITAPETGLAVRVRRKGAGKKDTRYEISLADAPIPLDDPDALCEGLHDITNTYRVLEPSRVSALLGEGSDPFEGEDGDAPRGKPRLRAADEGEEEAVEGEFHPVDPDEEGGSKEPEEKPEPKAKPRRTAAAKAPAGEPEAKAALKRKLTASK